MQKYGGAETDETHPGMPFPAAAAVAEDLWSDHHVGTACQEERSVY
jgi:hypothetical protein